MVQENPCPTKGLTPNIDKFKMKYISESQVSAGAALQAGTVIEMNGNFGKLSVSQTLRRRTPLQAAGSADA